MIFKKKIQTKTDLSSTTFFGSKKEDRVYPAPLFLFHKKSGAGFTLIEISVVLVLIASIALISVPIYRQLAPTITLDAVSRDIASDLRYAQQLSVSQQNNHSVIFNTTENNYTVIDTVSNQTITVKDINSQISIQTINELTNNTVTFNIAGASLESGNIILINRNNSTSTIEIKPSGYVKVSR